MQLNSQNNGLVYMRRYLIRRFYALTRNLFHEKQNQSIRESVENIYHEKSILCLHPVVIETYNDVAAGMHRSVLLTVRVKSKFELEEIN